MRNSNFPLILFYVFICVFCSNKKMLQQKKDLSSTYIDTTFTIIANDSISIKFPDFSILNLKRVKIATENSLRLDFINISSSELYLDTLSLDQFSDKDKYFFLYGPDVDCHLPLRLNSLKPDDTLSIQNTLKVDPKIKFVTISIFGTRNIDSLKNDTEGYLDTILIDKALIYILKYRCEKYPKTSLFRITLRDIPVPEMKGSIEIHVTNK